MGSDDVEVDLGARIETGKLSSTVGVFDWTQQTVEQRLVDATKRALAEQVALYAELVTSAPTPRNLRLLGDWARWQQELMVGLADLALDAGPSLGEIPQTRGPIDAPASAIREMVGVVQAMGGSQALSPLINALRHAREMGDADLAARIRVQLEALLETYPTPEQLEAEEQIIRQEQERKDTPRRLLRHLGEVTLNPGPSVPLPPHPDAR